MRPSRLEKAEEQGRITVSEIAQELGISAMTVSRALRGEANVSEATRQRVLSKASELNYHPNRWARSLASRRSHMIAIVIPELSHNFYSEIVSGVQRVIEPAGYDLILTHSHRDAEREREILGCLIGTRVDGILIASAFPEAELKQLEILDSNRVPFILLDRFSEEWLRPYVIVDDRRVGEIAAEHLISLGHRRISHIGASKYSVGRLRSEGFLGTLQRHGLKVVEYTVEGDLNYESGGDCMARLLESRERPTAVYAANDPMAIGAIRACREHGVSVPHEISIVGSGNIEGDFSLDPFLTTVEWPRQGLGEKAAEMLLRRIDEGEWGARTAHIFTPSLLLRKSTAPFQGD